LFLRDSKDLIDWSRRSYLNPWKARNVSESKTRGFELGLDVFPRTLWSKTFIPSINVAYTYLDSDYDSAGLESKYVLKHLRHQIHGSIILNWSDVLKQSLKARYEKRITGASHVIVDTRLGYKYNKFEFFLDATNLFDEEYTESGFSPMPGFWIIGGVKFII
jgi:iron complex outermembrane receptor protein